MLISPKRPLLQRRALLSTFGLALLAGVGCGGGGGTSRVNLPVPTDKSTLGAGDVILVDIVGEKDLPREYQVASDGSVELPYIHTVQVAGLEPQEVSRVIRRLLIERQVLTDPSVVVQVKEYNSRRITVLGQVSKPGTFPYTPGLTLIQALSQAGGLTGLANLDRVNLTRRTAAGSQTVVVAVGQIMEGRAADIPLQSGDRIFVHERIF